MTGQNHARGLAALLIAVSAAVSMAAEAASRPDEVGRLRPVAVPTGLTSFRDGLRAGQEAFAKPAEGSGTVHPGAMVATLDTPGGKLAVAVDAADREAKMPDIVRLDFSGRGRFEGAPVARLTAEPRGSDPFHANIGPDMLTVQRDGVDVPVRAEGHYYRSGSYRQIRLVLVCVREGTCDFGGSVRNVRLVDRTYNLAVNDPPRFARRNGRPVCESRGDSLTIERADSTVPQQGPHQADVGQPILLDGRWYTFTISDDQTRITARPLAEPLGTLRIDHDHWWVNLVGDGRYLSIDSGDRTVPLPAGTYEVVRGGHLIHGDSSGTMMWANPGNVEPVMVTVKPGETATAVVGGPVTLRVKPTVQGRTVQMDLERMDVSGLPITDLTRNIKGVNVYYVTNPRMKVTDANGTVVHTGTFEYG
ncbi:MAG: hypothetical protein GX591_18720 [Planctomycetes bacterium]|nr:hypothetical protein [Planctomycetota bacterium]